MEFESSNVDQATNSFDDDNPSLGDDEQMLRANVNAIDGGSAPSTTQDRIKKRAKRVSRQGSKELVTVSGSTFTQTPRTWKNSRRPRNGHGRGLPKKGGAGGKGVWGVPGSELLEAYEDQNDPNYDSESLTNGDIELKAVIPEVADAVLQKKTEPIVLEYYEHGDTHEAALALEDIVAGIPRRSMIVEWVIEIALDHKPSHREMTSVLISDLYGQMLTEHDIGEGFERLLNNLPDLLLDTPDAVQILGNFIARAIADDCLPPKFVITHKETAPNEHARQSLSRADTLLSMKHGLVRLDNVWGLGGGLRPVKYLVRQMNLLLQEFVSSGDLAEAVRCVRSLEVPHFHHELVYEAVIMAIEDVKSNTAEAICKLLKAFDEAVIISVDQLERGFQRVFNDMSDISIDVPLAYITLDKFIERCYKENFLTEAIISKVPTRGRKRFVSEGDGGHIKENSFVRN